MNKFDDIFIEYDGNLENPDDYFLSRCGKSVAIHKHYQFSGEYGKGFDRYIFLILEEKKKNWIKENRSRKIKQILDERNS